MLRTAGIPGQIVGPAGVRGSALTDPSIPTASVFHLFPQAGGPGASSLSVSTPVVTLVSGRRWEVLARVPESNVTSAKIGSPASFQFQSLSGQTQPCTVKQIVPDPIGANGTIEYEVVLLLRTKAPEGVLPGMSGLARLG